jgi:Na+/H+ antiporter NhaC
MLQALSAAYFLRFFHPIIFFPGSYIMLLTLSAILKEFKSALALLSGGLSLSSHL